MLYARIGLLLMNALSFVPTRVLFFTGKGGVGKTSAASATAIRLAEREYFSLSTARTTPRGAATWNGRMPLVSTSDGDAFSDDVNKFNRAMNLGHQLAKWFTGALLAGCMRMVGSVPWQSLRRAPRITATQSSP